MNAVIDRAIAELLTGDNGVRIRRRLEDIAYYLARVGRRTQAGWAAAAAARLRDGIDVTKDFSSRPLSARSSARWPRPSSRKLRRSRG